jgi:oligo-1,6-glucosidase
VLKASLARWQRAMADRGWNSLYWSNHDQPRVVSRFGNDDPRWRARSAKTLATVLHLHRGTPWIYQGEELGLTNVPFTSVRDVRDVESLNYARSARDRGLSEQEVLRRLRAKSRDNARTPVPWTAGPNGGFSDGDPWLAASPAHAALHAQAQRGDPTSVFHHYRRLIEVRHRSTVVARGDFELLAPEHERLWAVRRRLGEERVLMVANLSEAPLDPGAAGVPVPADAELLLGTEPHGDVPPPADRLSGWEARVYRYRTGTPNGA